MENLNTMKASEFDESQYLNAKSAGKLNGTALTIYATKAAIVGQDDNQKRKMIIEFEGVEKTLVTNKTNREILTEAWGDDMDAWIGKKVILHLVFVSFKGERTLSIQLEPVTGTSHSDMAGQIEQAAQDAATPPKTATEQQETHPDEDQSTSPPLGSAEAMTTTSSKKKGRK